MVVQLEYVEPFVVCKGRPRNVVVGQGQGWFRFWSLEGQRFPSFGLKASVSSKRFAACWMSDTASDLYSIRNWQSKQPIYNKPQAKQAADLVSTSRPQFL